MSSEPAAAPRSTYRLQLGPDLRFGDVAGLAGYLAALGVTHAYLSPVLTAGPGSTHGYDVVDHQALSEALGGPAGFGALATSLREHGIGLVVDVVPNHMAVPVPESLSPALWSALCDGPDSPYAHWFDVDWPAADGKLVLPVLDGALEDNLDKLTVTRVGNNTPALAYFDHRFPLARGTARLPLRKLLAAQHYRLADWRATTDALNYRRFMDITGLIAIRVEDPDVFEATHEAIVEQLRAGRVQGLRIDHVDGLADPAGYLDRLASATGGAWVVVEKILARGEPLPPDWRAAGTTGYDALTELNNLLVDPAGELPLTATYTELTGADGDFMQVAAQARREVARGTFAPELRRLTALLGQRPDGVAKPALESDAGEPALHSALVELFARLEVYRPYASSDAAVVALDDAARRARRAAPELGAQLRLIRSRALDGGEFATRFGQTAAAVFAKGVEDTAFYRYGRLLSLNEVGGDPARFGSAPATFHEFAYRQLVNHPGAMTTLSTHDTKRSEDVRARLAVLSELPAEWDAAVRRWLAAGERLGCPDPHTGYFCWQTLVGGWPLDVERATRYVEKAVREAKLHTSWTAPDQGYERAVREFVAGVLADADLVADIEAFVVTLAPFARANSLAQKLLQLAMPGVPDVYQGCEVISRRLVDPDNRGPVDFDRLRADVEVPLDDKLRVTTTALRLRRDRPDWFSGYEPLPVRGPAADHLVGFARSPHLVVLATRLSARLARAGGWRSTVAEMPPGTWVDSLSGAEAGPGERPVDELLGERPVGLFVPAVIVTQ